MQELSTRLVYEFGQFRLVPGNGLFRGDEFVHLPPKELSTLTALVSRHGTVVTKEELFATIWPGDPVSDESLTRCIYVLRKLFQQHDAAYIETLHRRGYRFAGEVSVVDGNSAANSHVIAQQTPNVSPEAREAFVRGMLRLQLRHPTELRQAIELMQRAIELEPNFARAYIGLAGALRTAMFRPSEYDEQLKIGLEYTLQRAMELDPEEVDARILVGWYRAVLQQEWVAGAAILDDVLQEKPKASIARSDRAFIHLCLGQLDDAIRGFQAVVEHDPFLVESNACLGWALAASGQREAALTNARAAVERMPSMSVIAGMHAYAATILGRHDEAIAAANRAVGLSDRNPLELTILATTLHRAGDRVTAEAIYQELTSQKIYCPSCVAPAALTVVGPEECLKYLEQAHATKCYLLPVFLLDPLLEPVRSQSRFEALVAAVRRNHDGSTNSNSVIPPMKLRPNGKLTHE